MDRVIAIGDEATGVRVLRELYDEMKAAPVRVPLDALWKDLGIVRSDGEIHFDDAASLSAIRRKSPNRPPTGVTPAGAVFAPARANLPTKSSWKTSKHGDEQALYTLHRRHQALLRKIISRIIPNDSDVDELVQESLLEVWRHAANYDPSKGQAVGWSGHDGSPPRHRPRAA